MTHTPLRLTVWTELPPAPAEIRDPYLDEELQTYVDDGAAFPPGTVQCTDPRHVPIAFSGAALYVARLRAGLSRAQLRDALLRHGLDVTSATIARWERRGGPPERSPGVLEARALAAALEVDQGELLECVECWWAAKDATLTPEELEARRAAAATYATIRLHDPQTFGPRFRAARVAHGLSVRDVARLADVRARDVVRHERGEWDLVGVNAGGAIADALDLRLDGTPDDVVLPAPRRRDVDQVAAVVALVLVVLGFLVA